MPRVSVHRLKHIGRVYTEWPNAPASYDSVLRTCGIGPDLLERADATVDLIREAAVVDKCCEELANPTFAMQAALAAKGAQTLMAYLAASSETVREALELARRYYALEDPDLRFDLYFEDDHPVIGLGSRVYAAGQNARYREFLIFGMFRRVQQIAGPGLDPMAVEIDCADTGYCNRLADLAGCEVYCQRSRYALHLPKDALAFPILTADKALLGHLLQQGESRLSSRSDAAQGVSGRIRHILASSMPGRVPHGDEIAQQLGMARRTMTRHLSAEGTSYKALLDHTRCGMAKALIKRGEGIAQVAFMLDFADQAAFSVAFKRWTGETPAKYRKSVQ